MTDTPPKHLDLDDAEHHTKAMRMLKKAKDREKNLAKSGALTRIPIRGGYILTNSPDEWTDLQYSTSPTASE